MKAREYLPYVSGLKGISCFFIMIGHLSGIIKYITVSSFDISPFTDFCDTTIGLVFREGFWLYLFFIASGYLLAQTEVKNIRELIFQSLKRFVRLGIPIFFSSFVIIVLLHICGLHNQETRAFFTNEWYQGAYSSALSVIDLLKSPFDVLLANKCRFNSPYWVLKEMFIASLIIFLWKYLRTRIIKHPFFQLLFEGIILYMAGRYSYILCTCLMGMIISTYTNKLRTILPPHRIYGKLIVALILLESFKLGWDIFFALLIFSIPYFSFANQILSSKIPVYLGKISWGIYSFHWPVLCSVGGYTITKVYPAHGIWWAILAASGTTILCTFIISHFYTITLEKNAAQITKKISNFCAKILALDAAQAELK